jgi:hypothetical protein
MRQLDGQRHASMRYNMQHAACSVTCTTDAQQTQAAANARCAAYPAPHTTQGTTQHTMYAACAARE